jgi:hypothetical protein
MPDTNPTWEEKKEQLYAIMNRLNALEPQVSGDVLTEIRKIKQLVAEVTATDPGTRNIGPGD